MTPRFEQLLDRFFYRADEDEGPAGPWRQARGFHPMRSS